MSEINMSEIKKRHAACVRLITSPEKLDPVLLHEFCFLQLRKICETIAISCLVAHGDIIETRTVKLHTEWNATRIIKAMARLHPSFYPDPIATLGVQRHGFAAFISEGDRVLDRAALQTLYDVDCARVLHLGGLDDLLSDEPKPLRASVAQWLGRISLLLSEHRIRLRGSDQELWVDLMAHDFTVRAKMVQVIQPSAHQHSATPPHALQT